MKRKVNLVGTGTLTISLPSEWSRLNKIKKGDDLDMVENENGSLTISIDIITEHIQSKFLDATGHANYLDKLVAAQYKKGYDSVEIRYSSPNELDIITKLLERTCMGYEIVDLTKDKIMIETVSKINIEEYDKIFKRNLVSLELISNDLLISIKEKNFNAIKNCSLRHPIINKYSDFCRRILNKNQNRFQFVGPMYTTIELLEKVADYYRSIAEYVSKEKMNLSLPIINLLEKSNEYYKEMKNLYYSHDEKKMGIFIDKRSILFESFNLEKIDIQPKELMIYIYLRSIIQLVFDFNGPISTKNA